MDRRLFLKLFGVGATYPLQGFATPSPSIGIETRTATASSEAWPLDEPNCTKIILVACGGAGIAMTRNIDKSKYGFLDLCVGSFIFCFFNFLKLYISYF